MSPHQAISRNAVKAMVRGAELDHTTEDDDDCNHSNGLVVKVYPLSDQSAMICDAQHFVRALVLADNFDSRLPVIAKVTGYVVSQANLNVESCLCITSLDIVRREKDPPARRTLPPGFAFQLDQGRIVGSKAPLFLEKWAPCLSTDALAGCSVPDDDAVTSLTARFKTVSDFLSKHHAMATLHRTSAARERNGGGGGDGGGGDTRSVRTRNNPTQLYLSCMDEFRTSQLDRQKASLTPNEGRESASNAALVVEQHQETLKEFMGYEGELTLAKLNALHHQLTQGLVEDAGALRTKNVRVAYTTFCSHEDVPRLTEQLLEAIRSLRSRWIPRHATAATEDRAAAAVTFAAAVFMGIVDCHSYSDGNGRLARIAANWALRRAGFPFVVHFFATPAQRSEYSNAVRLARRNLDLVARGRVSEEKLLQSYQKVGGLQPIVRLILDRLHKGIAEFNTRLEEKESAHNEQAEARMARRFRERSAAGTCLICFEFSPNIATLCCGKAVHLNCMAQWLSANSSCPQCRGPLPSIPEGMRPRAPAAANNDADIASTTDSTTEMEASDDTYSSTDDTTTTEEDHQPAAVAPPPPAAAAVDDTTTDDTTTDDTTSVAAASPAPANSNDTTEDSTMSTTDDTTTAAAPVAQQQGQILYCNHCNNRAARDCSNGACGRCCVLHGSWQCDRHGQT